MPSQETFIWAHFDFFQVADSATNLAFDCVKTKQKKFCFLPVHVSPNFCEWFCRK